MTSAANTQITFSNLCVAQHYLAFVSGVGEIIRSRRRSSRERYGVGGHSSSTRRRRRWRSKVSTHRARRHTSECTASDATAEQLCLLGSRPPRGKVRARLSAAIMWYRSCSGTAHFFGWLRESPNSGDDRGANSVVVGMAMIPVLTVSVFVSILSCPTCG